MSYKFKKCRNLLKNREGKSASNDNILSKLLHDQKSKNKLAVSVIDIDQTTSDNTNPFLCAQVKFLPIPVDNFASTLRGLKGNKTTGLDKILPKILEFLNYQQV